VTYLSLFALTNDAARRILRLPLSRDVQNEVTETFKRQEDDFNTLAQEEVPFDGKYKPDDGESLVIQNYDDIDGLRRAIDNPLSIPEIMPDPTEFATIKAIFSGYRDTKGTVVALIQSFDRRKIISTSGLSIFHSSNVYKKVDGIGITLDTRLAATLVDSTLRFFSFHAVRQIFDLSEYYIEATDADIREFATISSIRIDDLPAFIALSDSWVRRKVALIKQSQILEIVAIDAIKQAAATFNIQVATALDGDVETIVLPRNKFELKKILRFLDEDYYQSPLLNRNYLSNSKRLV
jgi:hypothetical protein